MIYDGEACILKKADKKQLETAEMWFYEDP